MSQVDPYYLLGVALDATADEIRSAYRRRAAELHPDRHPREKRAWASEQMIQLNTARDTLLDPARRGAYDQSTRLEAHKSMWRARRDAPEPPPPAPASPLQRRLLWRGLGSLGFLGMAFLLGLCLYSIPYSFALASAPDSAVFDDPWFWVSLFAQLASAVLRALAAPAAFILILGILFSNLSRTVKR